MADQAPEHKAGQKADPALAQYVVNLTPEQYEDHLRAAKDADSPRLQMEMGGSGTAAVHFHDAAGATIETPSVEWSSTGPVTVTPDEADPLSAKVVPTGVGPATITATVPGAQAHTELMVIEKIGAPVDGEIELTVEPPTPPEPPPEGGAAQSKTSTKVTRAELNEMTKEELLTVAHQRGAEVNQSWTKADIVEAIVRHR